MESWSIGVVNARRPGVGMPFTPSPQDSTTPARGAPGSRSCVEAIAAVNGLGAGRFEGNLSGYATGGADHFMHIPRTAATRFSDGAAVGAARRVVLEALTCVELLLARTEAEACA